MEALHNAAKHAAASRVAVTVTPAGRSVRINVTGDGAGFDFSLAQPGHLGLQTMAERASALGGDLEVITAPGAGARVQLTVPASGTADRENGR